MPDRQVVFYECQNVPGQRGFDRLEAVRDINDLEDPLWIVQDVDTGLAVIVDRPGTAERASYLRFLRIRTDTPYLLSAARELSLVEVEDDEAISEFTYAVLWPDGFMAAVSSRDAPAHKKLARYFRETSDEVVHIVNLFRPDVVERLKELRRNGLRGVTVKVQTSDAVQIANDEQARGWSNLFKAGRDAEAATMTIEMSVGRARRRTLSDATAAEVEELAALGDQLESMIVRGRDDEGAVKTIDMKKERIRGPIDIPRGMAKEEIYVEIERVRRHVEYDMGPLNNATRGN